MAIYLSSVIGLPVIYTRVGRQAGVVGEVQLDPVLGRVVALDVDHMDGYLSERVPANRVTRLGPRIVVVAETEDIGLGVPAEPNERWVGTRKLLGMAVLTEDGERVGIVKDVAVERESLAITHYSVRRRLLTLWGARLRPGEVVASGTDFIVTRPRPRARRRESASTQE